MSCEGWGVVTCPAVPPCASAPPVWGMGCGVWGVGCGVRAVGCGVFGVW